jgi:hypothetical protein
VLDIPMRDAARATEAIASCLIRLGWKAGARKVVDGHKVTPYYAPTADVPVVVTSHPAVDEDEERAAIALEPSGLDAFDD